MYLFHIPTFQIQRRLTYWKVLHIQYRGMNVWRIIWESLFWYYYSILLHPMHYIIHYIWAHCKSQDTMKRASRSVGRTIPTVNLCVTQCNTQFFFSIKKGLKQTRLVFVFGCSFTYLVCKKYWSIPKWLPHNAYHSTRCMNNPVTRYR